jgi:inner membrane protein
MTDTTMPTPDIQPEQPPAPSAPDLFGRLWAYVKGGGLGARIAILLALTLMLKIPLAMVGDIIADRQSHENEAVKSVNNSWGPAQTFVGPMLLLPYSPAHTTWIRAFTVLPDKLSIEARIVPQQRRRGLFTATVYDTTLDVVAEFQTKAVRDIVGLGQWLDWSNARLSLGITDKTTILPTAVEIDGQEIGWLPADSTRLSSIQAPLASAGLGDRDTVKVHFRLSFAGSGSLSVVPLGQETDVTIASAWPSPSFFGRYLPATRSISADGFQAKWSMSYLGRGYDQLWDTNTRTGPSDDTVMASAFGVELLNPVDAYRETDRAIKYGVMFIGLTFAAGLLFELATGTRPHAAQYGLIGLSLCVFYLLLLSLSEQIGFGLAYLASALAVAAQAASYNWAVQRRVRPALAFAATLAVLYAGLYELLQLEDVALLAGSLLLFVVLSVAMWFTRNLHRAEPS